jgi:hypothetical protein
MHGDEIAKFGIGARRLQGDQVPEGFIRGRRLVPTGGRAGLEPSQEHALPNVSGG